VFHCATITWPHKVQNFSMQLANMDSDLEYCELILWVLFLCANFRLIIEKEGPSALFKGLGPNLVGVAPSRAIYFCAYSQSKKTYNQMFPADSPIVHIFSAATAGNYNANLHLIANLQISSGHETVLYFGICKFTKLLCAVMCVSVRYGSVIWCKFANYDFLHACVRFFRKYFEIGDPNPNPEIAWA
jgi:hypothetical protein